MKKILFFIDPIVGNGDVLFRYATLKFHVPVIQAALQRQIDQGKVDFRIVVSEFLMNKARSEGFGDALSLVCVPSYQLQAAFSKGEMPATVWQQGQFTDHHVAHYDKTIKSALGSFVPDTVIVYESCAPYMNQVFPDAQIVNETWGAFSRLPMPALTTLDPFGTYQNSVLYRDMDRLRALPIEPSQRKTMNEIRTLVAAPFVNHDPCYDEILSVKTEFRKVVLMPLQIDDYYSFSETSGYPSHIAMVEDVLSRLPSDIGVIVTIHQDHKPVLDDARIDMLRKKYRNFVYLDALAAVPMVSSFMVLYVDAVLTVSSAVAFHAALLQVPVFTIGKSHTAVVSSGGIDQLDEVLSAGHAADFDNVLYWMLTHYQVFTDAEQARGENFLPMLANMGNATRDGFEYFNRRYRDEELLALFAKHSRESKLATLLRQRGVAFKKNEIYAKIVEAKVVSYDLFDTLVERPFIEPHLLFQLIEQRIRRDLGLASFSFMRFRRLSEEAARRERGGKETTLTAIYRHFEQLTGLSREQCAHVAQVEMEAEKCVLQRRDPIFQTMRFAKKLGKVVTIITDIYLEEPQIRDFLAAVDITEFDHLLVSATEDMRKHDGTIYPEYLNMIYREYRVGADGVSILHIGDNGHADCDMAIPFNIRAHVIPKAIDNLKRSRWANVFEQNFHKRFAISDVLVGLIANRFDYALTGAQKETLFSRSLFRAGYAAAGPMLFSFVQWLIRRVRESNHDRVYFLARDGYLLKQIYDKIREANVYPDLPPSDYIYASRRCAAVPSLFEWKDIVDLYHLSFGNRKLGDFLESRFGLSGARIPSDILKKHGYSVNDTLHQAVDVPKHMALLEDLAPAILENAADEREAFKRYLGEHGIETGRENICLVDIGYSGSIQKYMNKIYGADAKMAGYYMLTHEAARRTFDGIVCEGFYNSYDEQRMADCHPLNQHVFLFESVLSSHEGSTVRHTYDAAGNWAMVTKESNRELDRQYFMAHVHAGIAAFTQDFIRSVGVYLDDLPLGPYLGSKPFFHLAMHPTREDAMLFAGLKVENGFGGGDAWLLYDAKPFAGKNGKLTGKALSVAMGSSQWKEAAAAAFNEPVADVVGQPSAPASSSTQSMMMSGIRTKDLDLPAPIRKYLKFRKNPYRFFNESRNPLVRPLRLFYRQFRVAA